MRRFLITSSILRVAFSEHLADGGVQRRFGSLLLNLFRKYGLVEVSAEAAMSMWQCSSVGVSLMRANYEQARLQIIAPGYIPEQEFDKDMQG